MTDLLSTDGLIEAGVVDIIWSQGFRAASREALAMAQHGSEPPGTPFAPLPPAAVISCFGVHLRDLFARLAHEQGKYVVISRDCDGSLNTSPPACVKHLFSINVVQPDPRVTPMPTAFYAVYGSYELIPPIVEAYPRTGEKRVLVAHSMDMPGSVYGSGHERSTAIERFRNESWATVCPNLLGHATRTGCLYPWPWPEYAREMRRHDYLAAPRGYGAERMAWWEALALGTIPIVVRSSEMRWFENEPIAFVNSWSEVTEAWCDANLHLRERPCEIIKLSYWVEKIREKRVEIGLA